MNHYINKFSKALEDEFQYEENFKYGNSLEETKSYSTSFSAMKNIVKTERESIHEWYLSVFFELAELHFEFCIYALLEKNNTNLFEVHLSKANAYAYLNIVCGSQSCDCYPEGNPFIIMNKATFMMSSALLTHDVKQYNIIGKHLIDSLNGKSCIIKKGYAKATISWFTLKLYSLFSNNEITLNKLLQPKDSYGYDSILEDWDTENEVSLIKYIDRMCEIHILQASENYEEYLKDKDTYSLKYRELFWVSQYTFPYEVLTWLKLRELKGLKNPKKYSHPLMNTPIAKKFLDFEVPLEKPQDLSYAKELLVKIKEKCPDIEIPEWL